MPYLTPDDIPEDDDCRPLSIPASPTWLALFGGALTELTMPYNWEQFGALTVEETCAKMQSIIDNWYAVPCAACVTPGGYRAIRIGASGHVEQLNDEGEWEPATDEYYIPPPEPREDGTPTDQICLAAKNAVNVLEQLYESLSDSFNGHLEDLDALANFIAIFITVVGFEIAPITWGLAAFLGALFRVLYSALAYILADVWDEDVSAQITCFLIDCATNTDGVVTFDWECFTGKLNSLANAFSLTDNQLRLYAQIGYMLMFIGGVDGLNLAARTEEITDDDCSTCEGDWCYTVDLSETSFGFEAACYHFPTAACDATYEDEIGWTGDVPAQSVGVDRFMIIELAFPECFLHSIVGVGRVFGKTNGTTTFTRVTAHAYDSATTNAAGGAAGTDDEVGAEVTVEALCSYVLLGIDAACPDGSQQSTGIPVGTVITFYGTGDRPEGWLNNCG